MKRGIFGRRKICNQIQPDFVDNKYGKIESTEEGVLRK